MPCSVSGRACPRRILTRIASPHLVSRIRIRWQLRTNIWRVCCWYVTSFLIGGVTKCSVQLADPGAIRCRKKYLVKDGRVLEATTTLLADRPREGLVFLKYIEPLVAQGEGAAVASNPGSNQCLDEPKLRGPMNVYRYWQKFLWRYS